MLLFASEAFTAICSQKLIYLDFEPLSLLGEVLITYGLDTFSSFFEGAISLRCLTLALSEICLMLNLLRARDGYEHGLEKEEAPGSSTSRRAWESMANAAILVVINTAVMLCSLLSELLPDTTRHKVWNWNILLNSFLSRGALDQPVEPKCLESCLFTIVDVQGPHYLLRKPALGFWACGLPSWTCARWAHLRCLPLCCWLCCRAQNRGQRQVLHENSLLRRTILQGQYSEIILGVGKLLYASNPSFLDHPILFFGCFDGARWSSRRTS